MRAALLISALAVLAACSPAANAPAGRDVDAPSQAPQSAASATAGAPAVRLGRWNKTITMMGNVMHEVECVRSADFSKLASPPESNCTSTINTRPLGGGWVQEFTCRDEEGAQSSVRINVSGDLQNHYVADMQATRSGPGPSNISLHVDGVYEGPCRGDED